MECLKYKHHFAQEILQLDIANKNVTINMEEFTLFKHRFDFKITRSKTNDARNRWLSKTDCAHASFSRIITQEFSFFSSFIFFEDNALLCNHWVSFKGIFPKFITISKMMIFELLRFSLNGRNLPMRKMIFFNVSCTFIGVTCLGKIWSKISPRGDPSHWVTFFRVSLWRFSTSFVSCFFQG